MVDYEQDLLNLRENSLQLVFKKQQNMLVIIINKFEFLITVEISYQLGKAILVSDRMRCTGVQSTNLNLLQQILKS